MYVDRSIVTNVMIIGGSLYLLLLAKNYSSTQTTNKFSVIFEFVLGAEYLVLMVICMRQLTYNIRALELLINSDDPNLP